MSEIARKISTAKIAIKKYAMIASYSAERAKTSLQARDAAFPASSGHEISSVFALAAHFLDEEFHVDATSDELNSLAFHFLEHLFSALVDAGHFA